MERQAPRVLAPVHVMRPLDGLEVVVLSLELWPDKVVAHFEALEDAQTEQLIADHDRAVARWAKLPSADRGHFPEMPAERLAALSPQLSDDLGTAYLQRGLSYGGTGTDWRMACDFVPGVPGHARKLELCLTARDTQARLELVL